MHERPGAQAAAARFRVPLVPRLWTLRCVGREHVLTAGDRGLRSCGGARPTHRYAGTQMMSCCGRRAAHMGVRAVSWLCGASTLRARRPHRGRCVCARRAHCVADLVDEATAAARVSPMHVRGASVRAPTGRRRPTRRTPRAATAGAATPTRATTTAATGATATHPLRTTTRDDDLRRHTVVCCGANHRFATNGAHTTVFARAHTRMCVTI